MKNIKPFESFSMNKEFCDRCNKPTNGHTIMSMYNDDIICMQCKDKEKDRDDYSDAVDADNEEIKKGNFNYKGIGLKENLDTSNTYTQIEEYNDNEGEEWSFFLINKGNEEFIEKLSDAIKMFGHNDSASLKILKRDVPENEVNILMKYRKSGYMYNYNKCDKILDPKLINTLDSECFTDCFYKGSLFC